MNYTSVDKKVCSACEKEYEPPVLQQSADLCKRCHTKSLQDEDHKVIISNFDH